MIATLQSLLGPVGLGGGVILGLVAGARWAFARIDRYQDKIETRLRDVENDNAQCNRRFNLLLSAFYPVVSALRRHDPMSPELRNAETILNTAFVVDPGLPRDMAELLDKLDRGTT